MEAERRSTMSSLKGQLSNVEGSVKSMKVAVVGGSVLASLSSSNGKDRKGLYGGRSASRMNGKFSLYVVCVFFGVVVLTFLLDASSFSRQAVDFGGENRSGNIHRSQGVRRTCKMVCEISQSKCPRDQEVCTHDKRFSPLMTGEEKDRVYLTGVEVKGSAAKSVGHTHACAHNIMNENPSSRLAKMQSLMTPLWGSHTIYPMVAIYLFRCPRSPDTRKEEAFSRRTFLSCP